MTKDMFNPDTIEVKFTVNKEGVFLEGQRIAYVEYDEVCDLYYVGHDLVDAKAAYGCDEDLHKATIQWFKLYKVNAI